MNKYTERIEVIRKLMLERGIGLYYIPMDDCHGSEYVSDHFRCIEYISGFTGSAGQLLVSQDGAWLYADGRYYVQAAHQLAGSCIELMKLQAPGVPDPDVFIAEQLKDMKSEGCAVFGFDGNVVNVKLAERFAAKAAAAIGIPEENVIFNTEKNALSGLGEDKIEFNTANDLAGEVWADRPEQKFTEVWIMDEKYTGESCSEKLKRIREKIVEEVPGCDNYMYLISSLDDIAWIFNIRANDIPDNPECFAYAAIFKDRAVLYLADGAASEEVSASLAGEGVEIAQYGTDCLKIEGDYLVLMDLGCTGRAIYDYYKNSGREIKAITDPSRLMKGIKNSVELENACAALLRDSVYVTKFMCWLKDRISEVSDGADLHNDDGSIMSELSVDDKLDEFRTADSLYIEKSFATIAAYKENGAMMHYQAKPESFSYLKAEGMLLIDSGVQFYDGTTDITRTFILGPITDEEKKAFTLTAVSMLRLMNAKFIYGCRGENLDVLAREPMWSEGWDYKCGTGHGVGHVLNVHEGPHRIGYSASVPTARLECGMVVTDEPGVYREGKYGIRTENEIYVTEFMDTDDGRFLRFEPMTFIPIDLDGIDARYMSEEDKMLLNNYHRLVYEKLSPFLDEETCEWLKQYTQDI